MAQIVSNGVDDVMRQELIIFLLNWENNGGGGGRYSASQQLHTHTALKTKTCLTSNLKGQCHKIFTPNFFSR